MSEKQFNAIRDNAIKALQDMHYTNDPHFILITGAHGDDKICTSVAACEEWVIKSLGSLASDLPSLNNFQ